MYDVAIVGAGPVGVVAANLCGQHGLSAVVFDREQDVYDLPRAAGMHDDVQRILSNAGLLDAVLPSTHEHVGAEFVDASGKRLIGIEFPGLKTLNGFPPVLAIAQPGLERALRACLDRHQGVELLVSHEVCEIEQRDGHVDLLVHDRARDERCSVSARWLIGADGASSFVRKACGISWDSLGYDHEWLVIDVECMRSLDLPRLCQQICDPARPTTLIPMPGKLYRWEFQLRPDETRAQMEDQKRVWELLRPWITCDDARILRAVVYRFHATIADRFRHGSVFLAGDAAHQTPPFMGQGLCTGVRDVENLVWKLAAVKRGEASDRLLDTYSEERHPMGLAMVRHSSNAGKLIDAYADMTMTGNPPPDDLIEYGYGGSQQLPGLSTGLLADGASEWIGRLIPQLKVRNGAERGRFDDVVGPHWAVLSRCHREAATSEQQRRSWKHLDAAFVEVADPADAWFLGEGEVVIVRPDRIVFSLGRDSTLPEPFVALLPSPKNT